MGKRIRILAVCGFGVGTSLFLKMNIEKVLKQNGIDADVTNADITTASSADADIVLTSRELFAQLNSRLKVPLIQIDNFMSLTEIAEKSLPIIKSMI